MLKLTQSRIGNSGTCFRTALACLLNLKEADVPDFPDANEDPYVNTFLAKHGLRYEEISYDAANPPVGLYLLLGISPRGGMHVVIEKDGKLVWDTHPQDGTGRGIVEPLKYGVLTRIGTKAQAKDAAPLSGKRLNAAAEMLRTKHDEIYDFPERKALISPSARGTMYHRMQQPVIDLVKEAEALLNNAKLDDDPSYWRQKLQAAKITLKQAEQFAAAGDYGRAVSYQDCAFSMVHTVIDKMRNSGRAKDVLPASCILKYDIADMLDRVGITSTEFLRRDSEQRRRLLETAFQELSKEKGGGVVARVKDGVHPGILRGYQENIDRIKADIADEKQEKWKSPKQMARLKAELAYYQGLLNADKSKATDSRRSRLHRALDAVMDSGARGTTSTELRDEIRSVKSLISGAAGITLKRTDPNRYAALEHRLDELLDAASYRTK